jgi:hypothetical protein
MSTSRSSIIFQTRPESYDRRAGAAGFAARGPCKRIGQRAHSKGSLARARSGSSCCSSAHARSCGSSKTSFSTVSSELGSVVRAVSASVERPEGGVRTVLVGLPQYSDLFQARTGYVQSASLSRSKRREEEGGVITVLVGLPQYSDLFQGSASALLVRSERLRKQGNHCAGRISPLSESDYKRE